MNTVLRPNYRRAREIKAEIDDLLVEKEAAERAGNFSQVADLTEAINDLTHAFYLTGVTSEYDL